MIKNAIYTIDENVDQKFNILGWEKITILSTRLFKTRKIVVENEETNREEELTFYENMFIYEGLSDGRRDLAEMAEDEFLETLMHCYRFQGFVGEVNDD